MAQETEKVYKSWQVLTIVVLCVVFGYYAGKEGWFTK